MFGVAGFDTPWVLWGLIDRVQAAAATRWEAQYAASYSAGGTSRQADRSRTVFHQWTQAAVGALTAGRCDSVGEAVVVAVALGADKFTTPASSRRSV